MRDHRATTQRDRCREVEVVGRFIEQQQPRFGCQRTSDSDTSLFATRQRRHGTVCECCRVQQIERTIHGCGVLGTHRFAAAAMWMPAHRHQLAPGKVARHVGVLRHEARRVRRVRPSSTHRAEPCACRVAPTTCWRRVRSQRDPAPLTRQQEQEVGSAGNRGNHAKT